MKKLILTILLCLLVAGCNEEQCRPTAWIMGGTNIDSSENDIIGRLGLRNNEGIEFGAESSWIGVSGANQTYGAYALAEVEVGPLGTPYIGYHSTIANDYEDGGFYGPIAGTIVKVGNIETVFEYQYLDYNGSLAEIKADENDRHKATVGTRFRF